MPKFHNKKELEKLLLENGIPLTDAVKRGKFYEEHFNWKFYAFLYRRLKKSIKDICQITGLSYDAVRINLIKVLGKLRRPSPISKYKIYEERFFPEIDEFGSYFMGWLYSDGCLTQNGVITFTQSAEDTNTLKNVVGILSDKPVKINARGYINFSLNNIEFCRRLMQKYNVLPAKSFKDYEIPFEKFLKVLPYLLLGLFEGDGSISKSSPSMTFLLSNNSWKHLKSILEGLNIDLSRTYTRKLNKQGLLSIEFRGISYFQIGKFIYLNTEKVRVMPRKFNRFLNQLEKSINGKTTPKILKAEASSVWDSLKQKDLIPD